MAEPLVVASAFKPDRIDVPSALKLEALQQGLPMEPSESSRELRASAIRLQLRKVQVVDGLQGVLGTRVGAATGVYLITTTVDGTSEEPITFHGKTYRNISNGDTLPLGQAHEPDAVFNVYLREGIPPRLLSFSLIVFRSNEDTREMAQVFEQIRTDERYKRLSGIVKVAATAANPAFGTIWQASEEVVGLVAAHLKSKPDDQLGYYQANYTNAFDNLGVGRHPADAAAMSVDRIRFAYEIDAVGE